MDPVVHFELPYKDSRRVIAFYETVFGWKTEEHGPDMGDYILVTTAENDVRPDYPKGAINGGSFPHKPDWPDQFPSIVIGVHLRHKRHVIDTGTARDWYGSGTLVTRGCIGLLSELHRTINGLESGYFRIQIGMDWGFGRIRCKQK